MSWKSVENVYLWVRRAALHTSAFGFTTDFVDSIWGRALIFHEWWEGHHIVMVSYSAFAATLIVYIDGHRERVREIGREVRDSVESAIGDAEVE